MSASVEAREAWRSMTGEQYMGYLESLAANGPQFKVQSAESLFTPEEQAAHKAHLAERGERYTDRINDAAKKERDRIKQLYGEGAAKTFERYALSMRTADRFFAKKDDGGEWQIPNLIPRTGSGLHVGVSGSLKSFGEIWIADEVNRRGGYSL